MEPVPQADTTIILLAAIYGGGVLLAALVTYVVNWWRGTDVRKDRKVEHLLGLSDKQKKLINRT